MELYVVHSKEEKFRCAFYTLVIRNEALAKHYKGGMPGFMKNYGARCNDHITVWCDMGSEINEVEKHLTGSVTGRCYSTLIRINRRIKRICKYRVSTRRSVPN